jgi:two-component system NtrC family sensor kinase
MTIEAFYRIFQHIIRTLHSNMDVKEVLDVVLRKSSQALNAKGALLRIFNLETDQLELTAAYGLTEEYLYKGPVSTSHKTIKDLWQLNKIIIIKDVLSDPRVQYPQHIWEEGVRMILDLPLTLENNVVGIIRVFFDEQRAFLQEELDFLVSIAEQSAFIIDKAKLIEKHKSQYDQLALQTEKMSALGRMAAGIAHEINNPLAGILLYSTNLSKKVPSEDPLKEGMEVISRETIRCKSIIQELLEFSRESEAKKVLGNINDIIEKALSIMENELRLHHISVIKDLSSELQDTLLDPNQMEQVFVNLFLNAIEAIQDQGLITVRSRMYPSQKLERAEITDSGCGIPQKDIPKIFEPFFSTKAKGTGLGLAVSYGIVQRHQGKILVSSDSGKGTRFTIEIPTVHCTSSKETGSR